MSNQPSPLSDSDREDVERLFKRSHQTRNLQTRCPLLCRFGLHAWSKWRSGVHGPLFSEGKRIGEYQQQERICTRCNLFRFREEST